jgi:hypothetical protein
MNSRLQFSRALLACALLGGLITIVKAGDFGKKP